MKYLLSSATFALILCLSSSAQADEIIVVAPGGMRVALEKMAPDFERKTGHKIKATFGSGGATRQRVVRGETFDVAIVQPPLAEVLASGHVDVSSQTPLASISIVLAVRKGAPKPDISTPEAAKRTLLAANTVSYSDGAVGNVAGVSIDETMNKLGIADQIKPKIKRGGDYSPMALLSRGEVDIALALLSEINDPGVEVVGPLPQAVSTPIAVVGFMSSHAMSPAAGKALLTYLSSPEAAATYKASGMTPGR